MNLKKSIDFFVFFYSKKKTKKFEKNQIFDFFENIDFFETVIFSKIWRFFPIFFPTFFENVFFRTEKNNFSKMLFFFENRKKIRFFHFFENIFRSEKHIFVRWDFFKVHLLVEENRLEDWRDQWDSVCRTTLQAAELLGNLLTPLWQCTWSLDKNTPLTRTFPDFSPVNTSNSAENGVELTEMPQPAETR